jgi:hypothetical protein
MVIVVMLMVMMIIIIIEYLHEVSVKHKHLQTYWWLLRVIFFRNFGHLISGTWCINSSKD